MTTKRFTTNGYYIYDHFKEDKWLVNEVEAEEIVTVMNNLDTKARERSKALGKLQKENEHLKKLLECSRKEANDYCEELMSKDEFIRLYKRQRDEFMEENEQLKEDLHNIRKAQFEDVKEFEKLYKENDELKEEIETLHEQLAHFNG